MARRRRNPLHVGEDAVFALAFGAGGALAMYYYMKTMASPSGAVASGTVTVPALPNTTTTTGS